MRKTFLFVLSVSLVVTSAASAQDITLPSLSPAAKVSQTVGLTEITVEYSSPAVKGRPVFGSLVPYGEVWRAGANMATKITFSKDVSFAQTQVPAGTYAFFVIPQKSGAWNVIINKDFNQGGSSNYKKELDVVRVDVKPEMIPSRERLAFGFANFTVDQGFITLEWEKVRLSVPFKTQTPRWRRSCRSCKTKRGVPTTQQRVTCSSRRKTTTRA
jgi:Protein of unknown function (DUF2911)